MARKNKTAVITDPIIRVADLTDAELDQLNAVIDEVTTPEIVAAEAPAVQTDVTPEPAKIDRQAAYQAIVEANRSGRNQTRTARFEAVKALMEAGKSMPAIAVELELTYRQVKHAAWYVQHPEVPMPTR